MLLLYVPFKREDALVSTLSQMTPTSPKKQGTEGLYDRSQSDYFTRKNDEGEINKFTAQVFGNKTLINFHEYTDINSNISSEMFTSLMRVLHDSLPCSKNFFHMKRQWRQHASEYEYEVNPAATIKAIASPRLVRGLSIGKSPGRKGGEDSSEEGNSPTSTGGEMYQSRFQSMHSQFSTRMPDVRVKKNMNPNHVRNHSRQNAQMVLSQN